MRTIQLPSEPPSRGIRRSALCLLLSLCACTTNAQLSLGHHELNEPAAGACGAALYAAQLTCTINDGASAPWPGAPRPPPGAGPASMSTSTELMIMDVAGTADLADVSGDLSFTAWDTQFNARLEGQLDCAAGSFEAEIVDGMFRPIASPMALGAFVGRLDGQLDASGELAGNWFHGPFGMPATRCQGAWTAMPADGP